MDFPIFHLDFFGNRVLFGVIAILHVLINHSMAVGAVPLIATMEWWGRRTGDAQWDRLAYRILFVCFIITTTLGALSGVGIWLSASLVNPNAITTLIRIFFWGWFFEWIIFVIEVCLIMAYFLTWNGWGRRHKVAHIVMGYSLAFFSWITMVVIVAILSFMMDIGTWAEQPSLLTGVLNPIYIPQLAFRTPVAMVSAGIMAMFLVYFFTERRSEFYRRAVRFTSVWTLAWALPALGGAFWYWQVIPDWAVRHIPVALGTQAFERWHATLVNIILAAVIAAAFVALWGLARPKWLPRVVLIVPFVLAMALLGYFERVREFIRKPYAVANLVYSNGLRPDDYALLQEEGVLAHATYVPMRTITPENRLEAGRHMFLIACTRCHTTTGVNGVVAKLTNLYGSNPWEHPIVLNYLKTMHNSRPFMPPAPGTDEELSALADYLLSLQTNPVRMVGAQTGGVQTPPAASAGAATPMALQP